MALELRWTLWIWRGRKGLLYSLQLLTALGETISGSGGLIERLPLTRVDVVSLDWTVDMAEGRRRLGPNVAVQGNVDPGVIFGSKEFITNRIKDTVRKAGKGKHILYVGHGIVVGTPEENVAHFFEVAKGLRYYQFLTGLSVALI